MEQIQTTVPAPPTAVTVSVIIPVYNTEVYLSQCLESALRQTLPGIEILCVDDGSTDRSLTILREFERLHPGIRVFATENLGAAHARNLALDHARGEYVAFLDADDYYYTSTALEKLYRAAKAHQVPICGGLRVCDLGGRICAHPLHRDLIRSHPAGAPVRYRDYQQDYHFHNYIYRRELLAERNLRFPAYRRYEDPVFFAAAMTAAGSFFVIPEEVYCYRRKGGMLRLTPRTTLDTIRGIMDNMKLSSAHGLGILHDSCVRRLNGEYCLNILEAADSSEKEAVIALLEEANALQDDALLREVNPRHRPGTELRPLELIRSSRPFSLQRERVLAIGRKLRDVGLGYALKAVLGRFL